MNGYIVAAAALGLLMAVAVVIGRFLESDVSEEDVQRTLDEMDPHGLKRSFERRELK